MVCNLENTVIVAVLFGGADNLEDIPKLVAQVVYKLEDNSVTVVDSFEVVDNLMDIQN